VFETFFGFDTICDMDQPFLFQTDFMIYSLFLNEDMKIHAGNILKQNVLIFLSWNEKNLEKKHIRKV